MKIIYIGGYGRSGSTVLDLLLGQHKEIVSGGELVHVLKQLKQDKICTCGEKASHCNVWRRCSQYLESQLKTSIGLEELSTSKQTLESVKTLVSHLLAVKFFNPSKKDIERFALVEKSIDYAFREVGGFRYRVDSSKSARLATARALSLKRFASRDVFFIHLIRDPLRVANSLKKGSNRKIEVRLPSGGTFFMVRGLIGWGGANIVAFLTRMKLGEKKCICIDFDEFLASPEETIQQIFKLLELKDNGVIQYLERKKNQAPLHILSGNRMRNQKLVVAKRYKSENNLSMLERFLIIILCRWVKQLCEKN